MNRRQIAKMLEDMQTDRGGDYSAKASALIGEARPEADVNVRGIGTMSRRQAVMNAGNIARTIYDDIRRNEKFVPSDVDLLKAYVSSLAESSE